MSSNKNKRKMDDGEINLNLFKKVVKDMDNHLWNVTNNVTCTICHELFIEPVITPCGHSFCSKCLKRVLSENNTGGCPLCRHTVQRRKIIRNHVLMKIAQIWSEVPDAFKEDVTNIGSKMKELSTELVKNAKISGISSGKEKDGSNIKARGRQGRARKDVKEKGSSDVMNDISSHVSVTVSNVVNNDGTLDLKSISQVDQNSQLYVEESLEVEKDLRKVKRVPSKQKVTDWLEKVNQQDIGASNGRENPAPTANDKGKGEEVKKKATEMSTSMLRIDYLKSMKAPDEQTNDPYEFIPSQRNVAPATKRRASTRGRKKSTPKFESIQSFTKDSLKKVAAVSAEKNPHPKPNKSNALDEKIFPSQEELDRSLFQKTYSRRSERNVEEKTTAAAEDITEVKHDRRQGRLTSEKPQPEPKNQDADEAESVVVKKVRVRRRLLPMSDRERSEKTEVDQKVTKKPKLDPSVEMNAKCGADDDPKTKLGVETANKCPQSPGWSRLSDLKKDFESTGKRKLRRCVDVTGKTLTRVSMTESAVIVRPPEGEEDFMKTYDPLNKSSELLLGFDNQEYTEEETDFKRMVARMEREVEEANFNVKSVSDDDPVLRMDENPCLEETKNEEKEPVLVENVQSNVDTSDSPNLVVPKEKKAAKAGNRKTIPFSLLGRIKHRRKSSALFLQLGNLSRNSKRTVVKLVLPKYCHRKEKKVTRPNTATSSTQTVPVATDDKAVDMIPPTTVDTESQTSGLHSRMETKEVQVSVDQKSVNVQTDAFNEDELSGKQQMTSLPSRIFEELNNYSKDVLKIDGVERIDDCSGKDETELSERDSWDKKNLGEVEAASDMTDFNTELQCEMNKSWAGATQMKPRSIVKFSSRGNPPNVGEDEDDVVDLVTPSNGSELLMNRVMDNINLDLERVKAVSSKASLGKRCGDNCEESDSDIFIEQTPPKTVSLNKTAKDMEGENDGIDAANGTEESFLLLSECQNGDVTERTLAARRVMEGAQNTAKPRGDNDENNQNRMNSPWTKGKTAATDGGEFKVPQTPASKRICIVSSGLNNRKNLDEFVGRFRIEHSICSKKEMTHLVVGLHENEEGDRVPHCTPKVLYAIANKKWVVTEEWIEACLKADAIVPEASYESVDPGGGNGCNAARLSTGHLLENCEVFLLGEFEGITKDEFAGLITDCGGTVVNHPRQFSLLPSRIRMILADGSGLDEGEEKSMKELMFKCRTAIMSRDVIIVSIQNYKLTNFLPYLLHPMSSDKLVKWGYPYVLVRNESGDNGKNDANP